MAPRIPMSAPMDERDEPGWWIYLGSLHAWVWIPNLQTDEAWAAAKRQHLPPDIQAIIGRVEVRTDG